MIISLQGDFVYGETDKNIFQYFLMIRKGAKSVFYTFLLISGEHLYIYHVTIDIGKFF